MSHSVAPRPIEFAFRPCVVAREVTVGWVIAGERSPLEVHVTLAQGPGPSVAEPGERGLPGVSGIPGVPGVLGVLAARAMLGDAELLRLEGSALAGAACRIGPLGMWHIDVPGVLAATLRGLAADSATLLYAWSPLLAQLHAGGRIERPEVTIAGG